MIAPASFRSAVLWLLFYETRSLTGVSVSADIINLNQFRKARQKDEKQEKAAQNRKKHGRSKAEKLADKEDREKAERQLAGKKLADGTTDDDPDTPV